MAQQYTYDLYNISPASSLTPSSSERSTGAANKVFGGYGKQLAMVQLQPFPDFTNKHLVGLSLHCYLTDTQGTGPHQTYIGLITGNFDTSTPFSSLYAMCSGVQDAYSQSTNSGSDMVDVSNCDLVGIGTIPNAATWFDIDLTNREIMYMINANPAAYKGFWLGLGYRGQHTLRIMTNNDNTLYVRMILEDTYTQCQPPDSVGVSANNVAPNAETDLTFTAGAPGQGMTIDHYDVYRSEDGGANYQYLKSVYSTVTKVNAPNTNGGTYRYKIVTAGSVAGYNSGLSAASAALTCSFSAPAITSISIDGGTDAYKKAGEYATLAWAAANGTNNAVTKYHVYRDGAFYTETASGSLSVPANGTNGGTCTYTVYAIGTYSNSAVSPGRTIYTYSDPSVASVTIDGGTEVYKKAGENALLAWTAANGAYNQIVGYTVRRDGAEYAQVTGTSLFVPANITNGGAYVYSIIAKGVRSNSASSAGRTIYTYSDPGAPAAVDVSAAMANAGANVTLTVSGAANGYFNPVKRYDIHRAESAAGQYAKIGEIIPTAAGGSMQVSAHSTMGASYFYKAVTVGERSSSALSADLAQLTTNTAPTVPAILFPGADKTTFNTQPYVGLSIGAEPNGQAQTLYYSIDNGTAQNAGTVTAGTKKLRLPVLAAGSHTLRFWLADSMGAVSAAAAVTITIAVNTYARAIAEGTLLWNEGAGIRTSAELLELKNRVNQMRGYYGLSAISLPYEGTAGSNTIKHLHTWKGNMDALKQGLADTCAVSGAAVPSWVARERNAPSAGVVNQVRTAVGSL